MAVLGAKLGFRADDHGSSVPTVESNLNTLGRQIGLRTEMSVNFEVEFVRSFDNLGFYF